MREHSTDGGGDERVVLLVDDEQPWIDRMKRELRDDRSVKLLDATTADDALAIARTSNIDVAIIDINLKGSSMCGIRVSRELRRIGPTRLEIAVISVDLSQRDALACIVVGGADVFLEKPVTYAVTMARLAQARVARMPHPIEHDTRTLRQRQWDTVKEVLDRCGGNKVKAARELGVTRRSIQTWTSSPRPDR